LALGIELIRATGGDSTHSVEQEEASHQSPATRIFKFEVRLASIFISEVPDEDRDVNEHLIIVFYEQVVKEVLFGRSAELVGELGQVVFTAQFDGDSYLPNSL
jgi:hypothetical protein